MTSSRARHDITAKHTALPSLQTHSMRVPPLNIGPNSEYSEHYLSSTESRGSPRVPESPYRFVRHRSRHRPRRTAPALLVLSSKSRAQETTIQTGQDTSPSRHGRVKLPPLDKSHHVPYANRDYVGSSGSGRHSHMLQPPLAPLHRPTKKQAGVIPADELFSPPHNSLINVQQQDNPESSPPLHQSEQSSPPAGRKAQQWPKPAMYGSVPELEVSAITSSTTDNAAFSSSAPDIFLPGHSSDVEFNELFSSLPNLPVYNVSQQWNSSQLSLNESRSLAVPSLAECRFLSPAEESPRFSARRRPAVSRSSSSQSAR